MLCWLWSGALKPFSWEAVSIIFGLFSWIEYSNWENQKCGFLQRIKFDAFFQITSVWTFRNRPSFPVLWESSTVFLSKPLSYPDMLTFFTIALGRICMYLSILSEPDCSQFLFYCKNGVGVHVLQSQNFDPSTVLLFFCVDFATCGLDDFVTKSVRQNVSKKRSMQKQKLKLATCF